MVKTALFGEDPNWGRIVSAAGNSGVKFDLDKLKLSIGKVVVFKNGSGVKGDWERKVRGVMRERDITITLDLGIGHEEAKVWTTDLSYDYVKINGSYRS